MKLKRTARRFCPSELPSHLRSWQGRPDGPCTTLRGRPNTAPRQRKHGRVNLTKSDPAERPLTATTASISSGAAPACSGRATRRSLHGVAFPSQGRRRTESRSSAHARWAHRTEPPNDSTESRRRLGPDAPERHVRDCQHRRRRCCSAERVRLRTGLVRSGQLSRRRRSVPGTRHLGSRAKRRRPADAHAGDLPPELTGPGSLSWGGAR
jgi:hypothetical protein